LTGPPLGRHSEGTAVTRGYSVQRAPGLSVLLGRGGCVLTSRGDLRGVVFSFRMERGT
jgi:hypothetical protein